MLYDYNNIIWLIEDEESKSPDSIEGEETAGSTIRSQFN